MSSQPTDNGGGTGGRPHPPKQHVSTPSVISRDKSDKRRKGGVSTRDELRVSSPAPKKNANPNSLFHGSSTSSSGSSTRETHDAAQASVASGWSASLPSLANTSLPASSLSGGDVESLRLEQLRNQLANPFFQGGASLNPAANLLAQFAPRQAQPYQNTQVAAALSLLSDLQSGRLQQSPQDNLFLQAAAALSRQQQQQQQQQQQPPPPPFLGYDLSGLSNDGRNQTGTPSSSMTPHQLMALQRQKELDMLMKQGQEQQRHIMQEMMRRRMAAPEIDSSEDHKREKVSRSHGHLPKKTKREDSTKREENQPQRAAPQENATVAEQAAIPGNGRLRNSLGSIMPCRARGMPMDHNFKTAYFVIPENVQHGDDLTCSYCSCRNAGTKFCFCAYCKVPVAKRNFLKRHKHENEASPNEVAADPNDADNAAEEDRTSTIINIEDRNQGAVFEEDRTSSLSSSSNQNRSDDLDENYNADKSTDSENKNSSNSSFGNDESRENRNRQASNANSDRNRNVFFEEDRISSFSSSTNPTCLPLSSLSSSSNRRPEESTDSDVKNSSGSDEPANEPRGTKRDWDATNLRGDFEDITSEESACEPESFHDKWTKQWRSLLYERPPSSDNEALSAWLLKVLSTSNRSQFMQANTASSLIAALNKPDSSSRTTTSNESDNSTRNLPSFASLKKYKRRNAEATCEPSNKKVNIEDSKSLAVTESERSLDMQKSATNAAENAKKEDCASRKSVAVTESADSSYSQTSSAIHSESKSVEETAVKS